MPRKNGGQGADNLWNQANNLANQVVEGANQWNQDAHNISTGAQDWGQNNPYSQAASGYISNILGGGISQNPFMQTIHGVTSGLNPSEQLNWLQSYAGTPNGQGGSSNSGGSGGGRPIYIGGGGGGSYQGHGGSTGGGGNVPDTVGGQNTWFAQQMRDLFDPSHLDPANDPQLQPLIDMYQREAQEDYLGNLRALNDQAQASGRYGSGLYQAMRSQQIDEQTEGVSQAIAQQLMGEYQAQMGRRMQGLDMTNTRDIAAMQDMTNRYGIDSSANAAGAGIAAQMRDNAEARRLQAMGMSLDAQLGLLGLAGNMGSVLQQGQTDALNAGIGYGNLGMSGYNTGINAGQLGLGSLNMIGGVASNMASAANAREQNAYNREMARYNNQQDALNDYMNIIMGIGGMGGTGYEYSQGPPATANTVNPWASALSGGVGAGLQGAGVFL